MLASAFLASTLAVLALPQGDDAIPVPSQLDRVTIYSGQAMAERVFLVEAGEPGAMTVRVGPLPMTADRESFQTRVQGASAVLQGLEVRQRTGELAQSERDQLRLRIAALRDEQRALVAEREAITAGQGMLQAVMSSVGQDGLTGYTGMTLDNVFDFVTRQSAALDGRLQAYEQNRQKIEVQIRDLEQQLGGRASAARPYQEVDLNLFFQSAGTAEVRLLYLVSGASWEPVYDLRLDPDLTGVDVGLVGRIYQQTDEDWEGVQVMLSTAQPQLGLDPPDLPRRWARVFEPARSRRGLVSASAAPSEDLAALESLGYLDEDGMADKRAELGREAAFVAAPVASVQDFGLSQQFALPERVDLVSGTQPRQFRLVDVPLEVRPERYIVPSLSQQAYLRAEVTSEAAAPLLPGVARIFLGPDYLGESSFPLLRQGDSTTLNLGIDPNLIVEYEVVLDQREEPGLFSSELSHTHWYEARLKLSAAAREPVEVLIEEVLPVPQDDRIKISPYKMHAGALASEQDMEDRAEKGVWRWRMNLRPGQETAMRWGFVAKFNEKLTPVIDD
ncbi:MAG: hypothetical protein CMJ94_01895 [Planctomycetes bacterium]|nr:hypothetical protein [Planctomycetota bacterium]